MFLFYKLKKFFQISWFKTILINFRCLSFKEAIKLPIILYGSINIQECKGKFIFNCPIRFGIVRIGITSCRLFGNNSLMNSKFVVKENGKVIINGFTIISNGCIFTIEDNAILDLGENVHIGPYCKLYCTNHIHIGSQTRSSWECQIFDTNFHYVLFNNMIKRSSHSVYISNNCWIGNRVTIMPGTYLQTGSIVSSNSLVNKNFSQYPNTLFGGISAKIIKENITRIFDLDLEDQLNRYFRYSDKNEVFIEEFM